MNKYLINWYSGSMEVEKDIIKQMIVEAETINEVDGLVILPAEIKDKVYYTRHALFSEEGRIVIDYGNYTKFISIQKYKERK